MKRLIKKSKYYDSFKVEDITYEIYKDPSISEVAEVKKQDSTGGIRGLINRSGDVYIWAADILHDESPIQEYGIHFDFDGNYVTFNLDGEATKENVFNSLDIAQYVLSNVGIQYSTKCGFDAVGFNDETDEILSILRKANDFGTVIYYVDEDKHEEADED